MKFEEKIVEFEDDGDSLLGFLRIGFSTRMMEAGLRRELFLVVLYSIIGFVVFTSTIVLLTGNQIKQLKNALETTETVLSSLPFGMVIVGKDKKIRSANNAAYEIEIAGESEHLDTAGALLPELEKQFGLLKKVLGKT